MKKTSPPEKNKTQLFGLGLDSDDGQTRLTRGKNFTLYGGSKDTHAFMQETAVKLNEKLDHQGKQLEEVSGEELRDLLQDVVERIGPPRRP